jgi:hypothetical protein
MVTFGLPEVPKNDNYLMISGGYLVIFPRRSREFKMEGAGNLRRLPLPSGRITEAPADGLPFPYPNARP